MPEPLRRTEAVMALLADIRDRKVYTETLTFAAYRELPGQPPEKVSDTVWAMEKAGWAVELADDPVWHLTGRGKEVLDRGAP